MQTNQTEGTSLKSNINSELHTEVDTKEFIQKLSDFAKTADFDVTTLAEEHTNDPVLQKVRSWLKNQTKKQQKHMTLYNLKQ